MAQQQVVDLSVRGSSGLAQSNGYVLEEFLARLQGRQGVRFYREMRDNSSTIGAIAFTLESLMRGVAFRIEPASDKPEAKAQAEFVDQCLFQDMSQTWADLLTNILSMLTYGWAYHEICYKYRRGPKMRDPRFRSKYNDGKIGWRKMPIRAQTSLDRWVIDPSDSGIRGMWQMDPYAMGKAPQAFIPIEKALLFRPTSYLDNPEGRSIYRNAAIDYFRLKRITEIEATGIERDMTGLLTMEVPLDLLMANNQSKPELVTLRAQLERMLSALKRDEREFAMIPPEVDEEGKPTGYKLKLLATGGRRQIDTNQIVLRYMNAMTMTTLADFLMLGKGDTGSFALASSKTKLFASAMGSIMDAITDVFDRFAIPRLLDLNGVDPELYPHLVHGDIETPPLDEIGQFITSLATAGILSPGNQSLERKLLEMANLPAPEVKGTPDEPLPGEGEPEPDEPLPGEGEV